MERRSLDLGLVPAVRAESFGEPGHRTFRLLVQLNGGSLSLWLEKEQIAVLGSAIGELLGRVPAESSEDKEVGAPTSFTGDLEVRVGSLSIGFEPELRDFVLEAGDFLESPFELSGIRFQATREQFEAIEEQIESIVAGSRPRCVLCGTPLSGGPHFCPESNGHAHVSTPD